MSKESRYFLIAYLATKVADDEGYKTGFEDRMHYFHGVYG